MKYVLVEANDSNKKRNILRVPDDATYVDVKNVLKNWGDRKLSIDFAALHVPPEMVIHLASRYMYTFDKYLHFKTKPRSSRIIELIHPPKNIQYELTKQHYVSAVRDLINEPANIATPEYIASYARTLFDNTKNVHIEIWDEHELLRHNMNLILAVGKASKNQPRLVKVEYTPQRYTTTICLCGKGVTFDAGGLNLKPDGKNTFLMKGDKTGGCIVLGILKYFADIEFPCRVIGMVPLVENIISGNVTRPGDIIQSYSGKTVEIINTDAEGRLILADALAYCERYKPDYIMDIATLTGWAGSLHCDTSAIFFSPSPLLHEYIYDIGERIGERMWGMPRWLEYMKYCRSTVADLKNFGFKVDECSHGSGYMATMFMAHFVPERCLQNWVHFDVTNNFDNTLNANSMNMVIELVQRLCNEKAPAHRKIYHDKAKRK